ncbi:metadherin a isoform X2 [Thalassophryne amazonica]|uniref:metadherin a isoform X2 n=1 Tax=Thalassophryne amazonica TaxID=390379 RepID=UPI00147221DB|nr:metadherin a isoform X2 [Thalassophryne amazonica]
MAVDLKGFALEKVEFISNRLKELLSSGQGYVRAQFGVDLGLKPKFYPTWVVLSTALAGLLLLLALSWAAVCGGLLIRKKRGSPVNRDGGEADKGQLSKTAKPEEQKRRNKNKTFEKKPQSNGQPVTVDRNEVKVTEIVSKPSPQVNPDKVHEVQAPVQVKKNKKKNKTEAKRVQLVPTNEGKEVDDGAWETKVSNREKRQQRRKDKGSDESGSPGGVETPKTRMGAGGTSSATNKKNREFLQSRNSAKADTPSGAASCSSKQEPSLNGGGWTDVSLKIPAQMGSAEGAKWTTISSVKHCRMQPETKSWAQDTKAWSGIDGRIKSDRNPVSFPMLGLNTTDSISSSVELQWSSPADVEDEWSGFNGIAASDPSSDWSDPVEYWGNYEDTPVLATLVPLLKEQPVPSKVSEDKKDTEDTETEAAKSKKRRKKKKKTEEETACVPQTVIAVPLSSTAPKSQELPVLMSNKQNSSTTSSEKNSEQMVEPLKASQKKKVRRET